MLIMSYLSKVLTILYESFKKNTERDEILNINEYKRDAEQISVAKVEEGTTKVGVNKDNNILLFYKAVGKLEEMNTSKIVEERREVHWDVRCGEDV